MWLRTQQENLLFQANLTWANSHKTKDKSCFPNWGQLFYLGAKFLTLVAQSPTSTHMKILGIETSCDETAAAVVTGDKNILSNVVLSQAEHEIYGGVVPEVAARAHMDHIDHVVRKALSDANVSLSDLDGIAATTGPGLIGGVLVGAMMGKALARTQSLPFLAINHLEGHALTPRLTDKNIEFPYLVLLVSGGHTQILIAHGVGHYERLGSTLDDAVGEAFDKTAKLMDLGYPGGPAVEKMAAQCADIHAALDRFELPQSMVGREGCDMSFSGLKTAVRQNIQKLQQRDALDDRAKADLSAAFQTTVGLILKDRLSNALERYIDLTPDLNNRTCVVSGGVAANTHLRQVLSDTAAQFGVTFAAPPLKLCGDNGVMIAWAGVERLQSGLISDIHMAPRPRWPLEDLLAEQHAS